MRRKTTLAYPNTGKISKLSVSINVHLDDAIVYSGLDFFLRGARTTMEDEITEDQISYIRLFVRTG